VEAAQVGDYAGHIEWLLRVAVVFVSNWWQTTPMTMIWAAECDRMASVVVHEAGAMVHLYFVRTKLMQHAGHCV
jgi:hypothetical protein